MLHRIEDYTDSDLTVAISSPFNNNQRQWELAAELARRTELPSDVQRHVFRRNN